MKRGIYLTTTPSTVRFPSLIIEAMSSAATNSNESYCTFTLASDVTAGGLPSEEEIAKQIESNDPKVCLFYVSKKGLG